MFKLWWFIFYFFFFFYFTGPVLSLIFWRFSRSIFSLLLTLRQVRQYVLCFCTFWLIYWNTSPSFVLCIFKEVLCVEMEYAILKSNKDWSVIQIKWLKFFGVSIKLSHDLCRYNLFGLWELWLQWWFWSGGFSQNCPVCCLQEWRYQNNVTNDH